MPTDAPVTDICVCGGFMCVCGRVVCVVYLCLVDQNDVRYYLTIGLPNWSQTRVKIWMGL